MPVIYDDKVPRPNHVVHFTEETLGEYVKCAKSVKYFTLNHVKTAHPTKGIIPLELRPYQMKLLELIEQNSRVIGLLPRQSGVLPLF